MRQALLLLCFLALANGLQAESATEKTRPKIETIIPVQVLSVPGAVLKAIAISPKYKLNFGCRADFNGKPLWLVFYYWHAGGSKAEQKNKDHPPDGHPPDGHPPDGRRTLLYVVAQPAAPKQSKWETLAVVGIPYAQRPYPGIKMAPEVHWFNPLKKRGHVLAFAHEVVAFPDGLSGQKRIEQSIPRKSFGPHY